MIRKIKTENLISEGEHIINLLPQPMSMVIGPTRDNYDEWYGTGEDIKLINHLLYCYTKEYGWDPTEVLKYKRVEDEYTSIEFIIELEEKMYYYQNVFYGNILFSESLKTEDGFVFMRDQENPEFIVSEGLKKQKFYDSYIRSVGNFRTIVGTLFTEEGAKLLHDLRGTIIDVDKPLVDSFGRFIGNDLSYYIEEYNRLFEIDTKSLLLKMMESFGFDEYTGITKDNSYLIKDGKYKMEMGLVGTGLKNLIRIFPLMYVARKEGRLIVIKDLDNGLHVKLTQALLDWFNKGKGRLVTRLGNYEDYRGITNGKHLGTN